MHAREIRQVINAAEAKFRECWQTLLTLKSVPDRRIATFQPTLARSMRTLELAFQEIARRRRDLVGKKARVSERWFVREQRRLSTHQDALRAALGVGFSLGDAFAWFWYQFDQLLLEEHARCERQTHVPSGLGGSAEFVATDALQAALGPAGYLVLQHGTTTLLRLGDLTLVDLNTLRPAAIGEVKTGAVKDGEYTAEIRFISRQPSFRPGDFDAAMAAYTARAGGRRAPDDQLDPGPLVLPPPMAARAERQVKRTLASLKRAEDNRAAMRGRMDYQIGTEYVQVLEQLGSSCQRGRWQVGHAGGGLALAVYRAPHRTLYARISGNAQAVATLPGAGVERAAVQTCVPGSRANALHLGSINYGNDGMPHLHPGTMPLPWWRMDPAVGEAIVFGELLALTMWNPAPFVAAAEAEGYTVDLDWAKCELRLTRSQGDRTFTFGDAGVIPRWMTTALYSEQEALRIVDRCISNLAASGERNIRLKVAQTFYSPDAAEYFAKRKQRNRFARDRAA